MSFLVPSLYPIETTLVLYNHLINHDDDLLQVDFQKLTGDMQVTTQQEEVQWWRPV